MAQPLETVGDNRNSLGLPEYFWDFSYNTPVATFRELGPQRTGTKANLLPSPSFTDKECTRHQSFCNVEKTPGIYLKVLGSWRCLRLVVIIISSSVYFTTCLAFHCCICPVRRIASCRMPTVMADCWSWLTRLGREMNFQMTVCCNKKSF